MKKRLLLALIFAALLLIALLLPISLRGRTMRNAANLVHAPLFAILAALLFRATRQLPRLPVVVGMLVCWGLAAALGYASELIQTLVGRDASWQDVWADACGAAAGVLAVQAGAVESRAGKMLLAALSLGALLAAIQDPVQELVDVARQRWEMPMLASFETSTEQRRWLFRECDARLSRQHATQGAWALRLDLKKGKYPGVRLNEPIADWSAYEELVFDVHLSDGPPLELVIKIEDLEHNGDHYDRFHQVFRLLPGKEQIRVALDDVAQAPRGRTLDLQRIAALGIFTVRLQEPRTLYLDNLHLR